MNTHALIFVDAAISKDDSLTFNGQFIPEVIAERLHAVPIDAVHCAVPAGYNGKLLQWSSVFTYDGSDTPAFWNSVFSKSDASHIIKIPADAPFMQSSIITEMIDTHFKHLSEFTFSYNLPAGYSCDIISKSSLDNPLSIANSSTSLCDIIKNNLNQFDVELYYKEPDVRWYRVHFKAGNARDRRIMQNIADINNGTPLYESLQTIIDSHPEVLFTSPSYVEIELCGRCTIDCIFCYRKKLSPPHGDMKLSTLQLLIENMRQFNKRYAVCFGGSGEPLLHPQFYTALELCTNDELISTIVIETNGINADASYAATLASCAADKITTIININAHTPELYQKLHNADNFTAVHANILSLQQTLQAHNKYNNNLYIQIMKINETEPFLDSYYDFWEQYKIPIILQKQNTFTGRIPDRRYSDLTPLQRKPCWHLLQDLYVLYDGTIAFCKQDIDGTARRGNLLTDSLSAMWETQKQHFINDYNQNRAILPDCSRCDEWYTYNL